MCLSCYFIQEKSILFQELQPVPIHWRVAPLGWFREHLAEVEDQCGPIPKVTGLTADHLQELAAPFRLAFARVGLPNPQREKVTLERTLSFIHRSYLQQVLDLYSSHQDSTSGASKALQDDLTQKAAQKEGRSGYRVLQAALDALLRPYLWRFHRPVRDF
jgi:hypothetical protein